jgi:hypothetical protein
MPQNMKNNVLLTICLPIKRSCLGRGFKTPSRFCLGCAHVMAMTLTLLALFKKE